MKTFNFIIILTILFFFPPMVTQAQTSGASLSASLENRANPFFNESNYIDAYAINLGFDKCIAKGWVWYIGFRYTNLKGEHTCTECGVFNRGIEREVITKSKVKSYYWYNQTQHKFGVPISFKYFLPSYPHSRTQFFIEIGGMSDFVSRANWEGEYWENDVENKAVIEGPFAESNFRTDVKWLDLTALASIGAEIAFDNEWSMIAKPYLQYDGNWAIGGMIGIKRVLDNGFSY